MRCVFVHSSEICQAICQQDSPVYPCSHVNSPTGHHVEELQDLKHVLKFRTHLKTRSITQFDHKTRGNNVMNNRYTHHLTERAITLFAHDSYIDSDDDVNGLIYRIPWTNDKDHETQMFISFRNFKCAYVLQSFHWVISLTNTVKAYRRFPASWGWKNFDNDNKFWKIKKIKFYQTTAKIRDVKTLKTIPLSLKTMQ